MANPKPLVLVGTLGEPRENRANEIEAPITSQDGRVWWLTTGTEDGPQLRKMQQRKVSITVMIEP